MQIEFHHNGPWELPEGWAWARLGDLGRWSGGGTPSKSNKSFWTHGTVPWVSPKDMKQDFVGDCPDRITKEAVQSSATKLIAQGSVLMVVRSGILSHTFPVAVSDREVTINQDMRALTPHEDIDARYVALALKRLQLNILQECSKDGTTVASVEPSRLENIFVPIAPAAEQRRIVARIHELFTEIADGEIALSKARGDLHTWRRALLKAAVTGELTCEWREHNRPNATGAEVVAAAKDLKTQFGVRSNRKPRIDQSDDSGFEILPEIPRGWTWAKLSDFAYASSYGTSVKCARNSSGIPILRIPNIRFGRIDFTDIKRATSLALSDDEFLEIGDLLIVRTNGSEDLIGRAAIVTEPLPYRCYFASYLIRFRIVANATLRRWLALFFESPFARAWVRKNIASSAGQYNISQSALMRMPVPIPPELEMAAGLEMFYAIESAREDVAIEVENGYRASPALRQSILRAAFEGNLLEQDIRDEPADRLLTRLSKQAHSSMSAPSNMRTRRRNCPPRAIP